MWPSKLAKKFGLYYISFWTESALVFTLYYHLDLLTINGHFQCYGKGHECFIKNCFFFFFFLPPLQNVTQLLTFCLILLLDCREDTIDYIPGVKAINPKDTTSYLQETDTTSACHQIIFNSFQDTRTADYVLCNTVHELESEAVTALKAKIPFITMGPISLNKFSDRVVATSLWSESDCSQWLDKQPKGSVLYVSFGSYAHVSKRDLIEIANGIAKSKVTFIWILRPDIVSSDDPNPLPEDFKKEVADRSMIITWCCQTSVLAHPAIGGFLTHCGWNSVLEGLWCGVPLLCFPLYTDQFTNRKLAVDDWNVGLNLSNEKVITKEEVSKNVHLLMGEKSGAKCRNAAKQVKKAMEYALQPNGSSEKNMDQFIKDLKARIQSKCDK